MKKKYCIPECKAYHVGECNGMICQSTVEVTFQTEVQPEWDGKEDRVDLCREGNKGIWSEATEW